jgi:hypothetical protein
MTQDELLEAINAVGFDQAGLITALSMVKSIVDAGFTDPVLFTKVLMRFKLLDDKLRLQAQAAMLTADQQGQIQKLVADTNPAIGELNQQIGAIDMELAKLQG